MIAASPLHWLDLFCAALSCGPAFRRRLDEALGDALVAGIGAGTEGFVLVPPDGGTADIAVDAAGTATVSTDLVGPDAEGHPVTLAWRAAGLPRPLPPDPALEAAAASGSLEAWWVALPDDAMRQAHAASGAPPWLSLPSFPFEAGDYPFVVEWRLFPWPDIWLRLQSSGEAPGAMLPEVVRRLQGVQARWNGANDGKGTSGLIHGVGSQAAVQADGVVVNVDFGSAGPAALVAMLRALGEMSDGVPIARVTVGSAVLAGSSAA